MHRTAAIAVVASSSLASCGDLRSRLVAEPIWSHSHVVIERAALPKKPAIWENAVSATAVAPPLKAWQIGFRACTPSQLMIG